MCYNYNKSQFLVVGKRFEKRVLEMISIISGITLSPTARRIAASKLYKSLNNKLQYWSFRQVLDKLEALCELEGFKLIKVDPAYTSQTCSKCGTILKNNRQR